MENYYRHHLKCPSINYNKTYKESPQNNRKIITTTTTHYNSTGNFHTEQTPESNSLSLSPKRGLYSIKDEIDFMNIKLNFDLLRLKLNKYNNILLPSSAETVKKFRNYTHTMPLKYGNYNVDMTNKSFNYFPFNERNFNSTYNSVTPLTNFSSYPQAKKSAFERHLTKISSDNLSDLADDIVETFELENNWEGDKEEIGNNEEIIEKNKLKVLQDIKGTEKEKQEINEEEIELSEEEEKGKGKEIGNIQITKEKKGSKEIMNETNGTNGFNKNKNVMKKENNENQMKGGYIEDVNEDENGVKKKKIKGLIKEEKIVTRKVENKEKDEKEEKEGKEEEEEVEYEYSAEKNEGEKSEEGEIKEKSDDDDIKNGLLENKLKFRAKRKLKNKKKVLPKEERKEEDGNNNLETIDKIEDEHIPKEEEKNKDNIEDNKEEKEESKDKIEEKESKDNIEEKEKSKDNIEEKEESRDNIEENKVSNAEIKEENIENNDIIEDNKEHPNSIPLISEEEKKEEQNQNDESPNINNPSNNEKIINASNPENEQKNESISSEEKENNRILQSIIKTANLDSKKEEENPQENKIESDEENQKENSNPKPKKTVTFAERDNANIEYNQDEKITQLTVLDANFRKVDFQPRNLNGYLQQLKNSEKPKSIMLNFAPHNNEDDIHLIPTEDEPNKERTETKTEDKKTLKKSKPLSKIMQRNIDYLTEVARKRGNYNIKSSKKRNIKPKKNNCKKFVNNPQQFFTESLCENVLKSYDLDVDLYKKERKIGRSISPNKIQRFNLKEVEKDSNPLMENDEEEYKAIVNNVKIIRPQDENIADIKDSLEKEDGDPKKEENSF